MNWASLNPPYSTVVADPPWGYENRTPPWRSTSSPAYSLMQVDDVRSLPVSELVADDAHLYLWAVLPMMAEAYQVVSDWGFAAETVLTWCKPGPGLGAAFRGNTEHLIVARRGFSPWINPTCADCGGRVRGSVRCYCLHPVWRHKNLPIDGSPRRPFSSTADGTWYAAPRGSHSVKPSLFADLIERMSPGPYLELFARQPRLGWDSWGLGYELETLR